IQSLVNPCLLSFPTRRSSDLIAVGIIGDASWPFPPLRSPLLVLRPYRMAEVAAARLRLGCCPSCWRACPACKPTRICWLETKARSEEHTSELQSRENLVCRLL